MRVAIFFVACRLFSADLLVQGAVDQELAPLVAALQGKQEVHVAAWTFWIGRIGTRSVVISRTEVGPINAAAATALGIERFHPAAIINQGMAGAINPDLALWDIVIGEKATDYGAFSAEHGNLGAGIDPARWTPLIHRLRLDGVKRTAFPSFPGDARLIAAAFAVKYQRGKVRKGNVGSAFQYNRELDRIQWMRKTYGIDTEDMESAFSAGVATGMSVPFLAVRIVSDSEWSHPNLERIAGEYCAQFTLDLIRAMR